MPVYCSLTWNVFRDAVAKFYEVKYLIKKMKDKWVRFDECELYQRKAMLSWKKLLLRLRAVVYIPTPFGELTSQMMAFSEGAAWAVWPQALPREKGQVLLSKCPAYTQAALPEPGTERAVSKRDITNSYILLITRAGTSSFLWRRWMGPEQFVFLLFSKLSVSNHHDTFMLKNLKYIVANCRKQTQGYFCHVYLWKGQEFSGAALWEQCVPHHHTRGAAVLPVAGGISGMRW